MPLLCDRAALVQALSRAAKVTDTVVLVGSEDRLVVEVPGLLRQALVGGGAASFACQVEAKPLGSLLRSLAAHAVVTLEHAGGTLRVRAGDTVADLAVIEGGEGPGFPTWPLLWEVEASVLLRAFDGHDRIVRSPAIPRVLIDGDRKVIVSTNGSALLTSEIRGGETEEGQEVQDAPTFALPAPIVPLVQALPAGMTVRISRGKSPLALPRLHFHWGEHIELVTDDEAALFPDYTRLHLPVDAVTGTLVFHAEPLRAAIERASRFVVGHGSTRIELHEDVVVLTSHRPGDHLVDRVEVERSDGWETMHLSPGLLLLLLIRNANLVTLVQTSGPLGPMRVVPESGAWEGWLMPLRMN